MTAPTCKWQQDHYSITHIKSHLEDITINKGISTNGVNSLSGVLNNRAFNNLGKDENVWWETELQCTNVEVYMYNNLAMVQELVI